MSLGLILALGAAVSFGFNGATVRRGVATAAASQGLYVTVLGGAVLFVLAAALSGQLFRAGEVAARDYGFLVAGGLVHILVGRYCNYRAIAAMGANRTGPIVGMSTLASVLIALAFLGESVDARIAAGIALVMVGPVLIARRPAAAPSSAPGAGPTPHLLEGYVFGVAAAVLWGVGPVLMRAGLQSTGLGILGGLVTYAAASAALLLVLALPGQMAKAADLDRSAMRWFALSALNSFVANVFRFSALAVAPVTVVVPMIRTFVLFQVAFNFVINRSLESFEPRILVAVAVSAAGAVLLTL